ncbi:MAG: hypothetical protein JWM68_545 [Verrucomicrobiales bacterium]|nr:hypothetical protein [Verrucomicrobiales bacterium]
MSGGCYLARPMLTTKKRTRLFEIFFGIVLLAFLAGCTPSGPKALLEGDRLLQEGKFAEAIPKLNEALNALPDNLQKARAWNRLGLAYHNTGDASSASQAYVQALKFDRDLVEARFNLGCLQLEQGNATQAIEALTTYAMRQPLDPEGCLKLGEAQLRRALQIGTGREKTSQLDSAKKNLEQAFKLQASPEALNAIGMVAFEKGRANDALKSFQAALQMKPGFAPAILNMAIVYHASRDLNDRRFALKFYREYLATNPTDAAAVDSTARQLEAELTGARPSGIVTPVTTNRSETVKPNLAGAVSPVKALGQRYKYIAPPRPPAGNRIEANRFFVAALEAQRAKRGDAAAENYRKAIQTDGSFFEAHYNLQLLELEKANLPAALSEAELSLALSSGSVNARYNFALALDRAGYAQDAANELEKLLAQAPGEARSHLFVGSLYAQKLNDAVKARMHFMKVLELEPQHAQAAAIRNWLANNR